MKRRGFFPLTLVEVNWLLNVETVFLTSQRYWNKCPPRNPSGFVRPTYDHSHTTLLARWNGPDYSNSCTDRKHSNGWRVAESTWRNRHKNHAKVWSGRRIRDFIWQKSKGPLTLVICVAAIRRNFCRVKGLIRNLACEPGTISARFAPAVYQGFRTCTKLKSVLLGQNCMCKRAQLNFINRPRSSFNFFTQPLAVLMKIMSYL